MKISGKDKSEAALRIWYYKLSNHVDFPKYIEPYNMKSYTFVEGKLTNRDDILMEYFEQQGSNNSCFYVDAKYAERMHELSVKRQRNQQANTPTEEDKENIHGYFTLDPIQILDRDEDIHTKYNKKIVRFEIDLSYTDDQLNQCFTKLIRRWKKCLPESNSRMGKTKYDPWEVYDMHHKDGLSLLEIARKLEGVTFPPGEKSPAYNEEQWPPYQGVRRAYEKAETIIQAVIQDVIP